MLLQEPQLVLGEAAYLTQLCSHHLPRALLGWFAARSLPDPHHRRTLRHDEAVHRLDQVVLEPGTAELAVGEHGYAGGSLPFQRFQDGPVLDRLQLVRIQTARLIGRPRLMHLRRAQQAPHVVSTKDVRHWFPPPMRRVPAS